MKQSIIVMAAIILFATCALAQTASRPVDSQPITSAPTPATAPAGPICVAILEAEVLADLPADDRKALAGIIDTLLTESLGKQKGLVLVDRQALDKVLTEKAATAGGIAKVAPGEVAQELRPFWSAGVLICPVVRQVKAATDKTPGKIPELLVEVDAVLAQTGQSLGEAHAAVKWQNRTWDNSTTLEVPLNYLWSDLPDVFRQMTAKRHIEIADVRLTSSLRRLQWMADDVGDSLRASLAQPGVALLQPRHPASTKEERLLRVMGLSSPNGKDESASLSCSPDFRLDVELSEEVGKDLDYDKTPITLSLSLQGQDATPVKETFTGKASQYSELTQQASAWLHKQLGGPRSATSEAQDHEYSRQLAQHELEAARQLLKGCKWYSHAYPDTGPEHLLRARILDHALRASHLDPTNEEAARLVVLGIDSPYCIRGDGRSSVCADRVIAEGQRYLRRFAKNRNAAEVRQLIGGVAFGQLSEIRQRGPGDWISLPYNQEICRYGKVSLLSMERDVKDRIEMNIWADANVVGECILGHCPPDRLEEERTYWRAYWKKIVEPLKGDVPTWEFIEIKYYIRKKDSAGLREDLNVLASQYPRSHQKMWWGTGPYPTQPGVYTNKPCWKVRVELFLKLGGDKDWQTWEPTFVTETFTWSYHDFEMFAGKLDPPMPRAWDAQDALTLPGAKITIDVPGLPLAPGHQRTFRPLLAAGGFMWLCDPPLDINVRANHNLWVVPLKELEADGKDLHVKAQAISWPDCSTEVAQAIPFQVVRCWADTVENEVPTVWVGTNDRGLARFELKDGKWTGRWYAAKQGVPGEDILLVRPCLHEGKRKLLILSLQRVPRPNDFEWFLWVLDPSNGRIGTILSNKKYDSIWYNTQSNQPEYMAFVAVWKNHTKVPLCLYDYRSFPNLDVADIVSLKKDKSGFAFVKEELAESVWRYTDGGLVLFDSQWSPTWLLAIPPITDEICFYSSPDTKTHFAINYAGCCSWRFLQSPMIDMNCCSDSPAVAWGMVGRWDEVQYGCSMLTAYRPASKAPLAENDAWYGPWKTDNAISSINFIDGYLWASMRGGELYRIKPSEAIAQAQEHGAVRSTAKWRPEYQRRMESSWINAARMHLTLKEYDQALAVIAAARKTRAAATSPAGASSDIDFYEALIYARKGDYSAADRAYQQLADDAKVEPYFRGLALMALANVRLSTKDWSGMNQALDKLIALFPGLNSPDHFSEAKTIQWYRNQARQYSPTTKPAPLFSGASRPSSNSIQER